MQKKILLINPWIYDFAAFDLWLKPLGLLYLSTILKQQGFSVSLIDLMDRQHSSMRDFPVKNKKFGTGKFYKEPIKKPNILKFVPRSYSQFGMPKKVFIKNLQNSDKPDVILVTSMMTYWYNGVAETIEIIKTLFPDVPVVLGGIYALLMPDHAKKNTKADFVCKSNTLSEIGKLLNNILKVDLNFKKFDSFVNWPAPDFSYYPNSKYSVLTTSLGCVYKCSYCASPILYPYFYRKLPETVFQEILDLIQDSSISDLAFYDDALFINKEKYFIPLIKKILKAKLNLNFHTPNGLHAKMIDEKLADLLYETKFKTLRLSLETNDEYLQKSTGGKVTNKEYERAIHSLQKAGYKQQDLKTYILIGMPNQNKQQIIDAIHYVKDLGATPSLAEYSIIPRTKDWLEYKELYDLEHLDPLLHNNSVFSVYMNFISFEELQEFKQVVRE